MHVVILGAGYAGVACALRLARLTKGKVTITLVNGSEQFIERIRLHERAAGSDRASPTIAELVRDTGVRVHLGWATELDLQAQRVRVGEDTLRWDRLVLALGSTVDLDSTPGVREHAYTLDAESAAAFASALPKLLESRARVVVVGGGLSGIEAATELAEAHPELSVELITREGLAPGFSEGARDHARRVLRRLSVRVREHVRVTALSPDGIVNEGTTIPYAAAIWAGGFALPKLAAESGLRTNDRGQVWVDANLRALAHPNVFVAGDLAALSEGGSMPMGCKSALPSGMHAAHNVARSLEGAELRPFAYRQVPFCVSLGRRDGIFELPAARLENRDVWTGRLAASIKEFICRGTLWALRVDRYRAARATKRPSPAALSAETAA